jgi:hypothetical protein
LIMVNELKEPIFIIGNTRSGTTILQNVVAQHPSLVRWYEPRNIWQYADPGRAHDEFNEDDASEKVKRYVRKRFLQYQREQGNRTILENTPVNVLRVGYVHAIFPEATFIYIIRDPFSVISSMELKWQKPISKVKGIRRRLRTTPVTQLHHYLWPFVVMQFNKRVLRRKYLPVWGTRYEGIQEDLKTHDHLTVMARQWAVGSRKAEEGLARIDDRALLRLRYEDFVEDPMSQLKRILSHCGLEMTDEVAEAARSVDPDRREKWRRFDPATLATLLPELTEEMERHGYQVPAEIASAANDPIEL